MLDDIDAGKGSYGVTESSEADINQAYFTTQAITGRTITKDDILKFNKNSNFTTTPAFTYDVFNRMDASISQGNPVFATRKCVH